MRYYFVPRTNKLLRGTIAHGPERERLKEAPTEDSGLPGEIGGARKRYDLGQNFRPDLDGSHPFGSAADFAGKTPVPAAQPPEPDCTVAPGADMAVRFEGAAHFGDGGFTDANLAVSFTDDDTAAIALWLRPEELTGFTEGAPVSTWSAAPGTARAAAAVGAAAPVYHVDPGTARGGLVFEGESPVYTALAFPALAVAGDFVTYVVARQLGPGTGGPLLGDGPGTSFAPLLSRTTAFVVAGDGTPLAGPATADYAGRLALWSARRLGTELQLWEAGAQLASGEGGAAAPLVLELLASQRQLAGVSARTWIAEAIVYPRALSPEEDTAVWDYLATKYREEEMPTGAYVDMALDTPMTGYLLCDGSQHLITDFPDLADYLGGEFDEHRGAAAPDTGYFRVPDWRGLFSVGGGADSINPPTGAYAAADTGGEEVHTLTDAEVPATDCTVTDPGHFHNSGSTAQTFIVGGLGPNKGSGPDPPFCKIGGTNTQTKATGITAAVAGGGGGHENRPPFGVAFRFIKT